MLNETQKKRLTDKLYNLIKEGIYEDYFVENDDTPKTDSDDKVNKKKEAIVIRWLNNPAVNNAAVMRKLNGDKESNKGTEEDASGRSLFAKKKNGAKNDNGSVYHFSPEEVNRLYDIQQNNMSGEENNKK